jgi:CRISPR/Cas system-associated exonuclease Cas4 (RecB family)
VVSNKPFQDNHFPLDISVQRSKEQRFALKVRALASLLIKNNKMNPIDIINKRNKESNLQFNEAEHIYTIEGSIVLESVTTKLKKFFPFDLEAISKKVASIRGVTQDEIKAMWKKTADDGTEVHLLAEKYSLGQDLSDEELGKIKHAIAFFKKNDHLEILGCEVQLFSKKYGVAGTADLMVRNKENNKIYVLDYKTCNKEIKKDDIYHMAQGVLKDFPNNKFYNYSMQVSVYSHLLKEEYGIEVYKSMLVHLKKDDTFRIVATEDMGMFVHEALTFK